ncbi:hypothetical protein PoB_003555500 [Plakobranchus ocellatus]|uniref:Uncharacterized protein n=1 Tax=Plakobranchus ocellatus TaxID=259542 RepID=A0AAV4ANW7_9GAST|nr:hypothetical protein PoB_003555500 [Plakobranchus ocellatus]
MRKPRPWGVAKTYQTLKSTTPRARYKRKRKGTPRTKNTFRSRHAVITYNKFFLSVISLLMYYNEEVLTEAQTTRQLMNKIRKRQAKFVGHVIRRNQLEHLVTTGKFDGKRGRGRPREKMLDSLADWMNIEKPSEMIRKMSCRDGWRSMIAHASRHGT